jgi:hypothetical protein
MIELTFPGGRKQIEEEARRLQAVLGGRLDYEETVLLLARTKTLLVIGADKSEERITKFAVAATGGRLTEEEARLVFRSITGLSGPLYTGGDGSSREKAVIINTTASAIGISAEYQWITSRYGPQGQAWTRTCQSLVPMGEKAYDELIIQLKDGSEQTIYFEISAFYGTELG